LPSLLGQQKNLPSSALFVINQVLTSFWWFGEVGKNGYNLTKSGIIVLLLTIY